MSLATPEKIRSLQRQLYVKAKAEPGYRFYMLYDKIWRADILAHAYALCRANGGAPGVDGETFEMIEAEGLAEWLAGLGRDLAEKTYRPQPVRRVRIPKPDGGERLLGIPTIRDRVAQASAKLVLEPVFEADMEDSAYGYRPGRSALDAVKATHRMTVQGYTDVVDADLSRYFDTIPHGALMQSVARRICDKHVLRLIKLWLEVPVEEQDGDGKRRTTGGKGNRQGTPQGGVISPLLANLYINRFLKHWRLRGCETLFQAKLINYADDFVILSRGHATEALAWTRGVMGKLGLTLNEAKTAVRDAGKEGFDFLGYTFEPRRRFGDGTLYQGAGPSRKSLTRIKDRIGGMLGTGNMEPWPEVRDRLNRTLAGWHAYFSHGACDRAHTAVERHVCDSVRAFLARRHKEAGRGNARFPWKDIYGKLGVLQIRRIKADTAVGRT